MCGIAGKWKKNDYGCVSGFVSDALVAMQRRGPDANGLVNVETPSGELVFGHARLSIIDLSENGIQPMWSSDRQHLVVFNGEIVNYIELRKELIKLGCSFRTESDTEVLLTAWQQWGKASLQRFVGMFAFAIYDKKINKLTCVRDAFGIKPFLYQVDDSGFSFASDMLGMRALSEKRLEVNWQRAYDYLVHGDYDSTVASFCQGINHLRPAHLFEIDLDTGAMSKPIAWWQPNISQTNSLNLEDAAAELRERFLESVRLHMRSDVRIGAALSGGLDSSSIVCAMRYTNPDLELHTFSYISEDSRLSEEHWVNHVNQHCNAVSHKISCGADDLLNDLDDLIATQGEPFGGTSIYAQYRVFKAAREAGVTVTLDGQGADELLGGYMGFPGPKFHSVQETMGVVDAVTFLRNWTKWPGRNLKTGLMYVGAEYSGGSVYAGMRYLYGKGTSPSWIDRDFIESQKVELRQPRYDRENIPDYRGRRVLSTLASSIRSRGLPSLLRHGDRNSMRFSVESRVPFLTTGLCDFLYSLPEEYLISSNGETKHVFRKAMRGIVPDVLLDRKDKIGFETPQGKWLFDKVLISQLKDDLKMHENLFNAAEIDRMLYKTATKPELLADWLWRIINFTRWFDIVMRSK